MKRFRNILLVHDQDVHGEAALRRAAALARQNDVSFAGIESGRRYGLSDHLAEQCLETVRGERRNDLDTLLEPYALLHLNHRVHLMQGNAGIAIPELVRAAPVDLIVMGTVCRTGLPGFFIGNTAETILQRVDCSVLTVKPEGLLSPVTLGAS